MSRIFGYLGLVSILCAQLVACGDDDDSNRTNEGASGAQGQAGNTPSEGGAAGDSSEAVAPGEAGAGGEGSTTVIEDLGNPIHVVGDAAAKRADGTEEHPFPTIEGAVAAIVASNKAFDRVWDGKILVHEGRVEVKEDVTLPATVDLEFQAGAEIAVGSDLGIHARRDLKVLGTEEKPVLFTWLTDGKSWNSLTNFEEASQDNVVEWAIFEHGGETQFEGETVRGALGLLHAGATISHCTFRNNTGDDGLTIKNSESTVEYCRFIDNAFDGIDEGASGSEIAYNYYEGNGNDAIDLGEGSTAWVHDNVMVNNGDKGVSMGEVCGENLIEHNLSIGNGIGMAIKDSSTPIIRNNTFYANKYGLRVYESVEGDGVGKGTFTNNIVWGSTQGADINLAPGAETEFSHNCYATAANDDDGTTLSVEGDGMLTEGDGCDDPLFANPSTDPETMDFHLQSAAGRYNPETEKWVKDDETSPGIDSGDPDADIGDETDPNGGIVNMGRYGGTEEASRSPE